MFNFIGDGILISMLVVAGLIIIWRKLAAFAPDVTDSAKVAASKKAISFIGKWLR